MNKLQIDVTDINNLENNFPKLIAYCKKNEISIKDSNDIKDILAYSSVLDGTNFYLESLCRPSYSSKGSMIEHKEELKKVLELAKMNASIKDALIGTLSRNGGHNNEQFIHKACSSDEIYSLIMDVFRAHNIDKEKIGKVMETKHTRDYGSSYFPFNGYHALQQYNTLTSSTNAIEKNIDLLPENHIRWLASRVRFGRASHGRDASRGSGAYDTMNKELNKLYGEDVTPKNTINKWHQAKLIRACTETLQPFYGNLEVLRSGKDQSKIESFMSHHANILYSSLLRHGEKGLGEDNRKKVSTHVFNKITLTSASYLLDTIRDVIVRPLLLPIVLNQLSLEEQGRLKEADDEELVNTVEMDLAESFLTYLTENTDLTILAQLTQKAHARLGVLEKARDFPWVGDRYSILDGKEVHLGEYKAIVVDNACRLVEEGKRNITCLGGFGGSCLTGTQHVVVFRNQVNESIGYVRLGLQGLDDNENIDNSSFLVGNHNGYRRKYILHPMYLTSPDNISPKEDLSEAFTLFKNKIVSGDLFVNVNNLGKIASENKIDAFTNRVGFDFSDKTRIQKNFDMITARNGNPVGDSFAIRLSGGRKRTLIDDGDRNLDIDGFSGKEKLFSSAIKKIRNKLS